MANDLESKLAMTEDVETLELENVWTTGRKFLIAIIVAILLLIATGIVALIYINQIVKTHKEVVTHTFAMKEYGLQMTSELNRHKAAVATYLRTSEEATKTQVTDIRSKLLEISNRIKLDARTKEEEDNAKIIGEKLNYILDYGNTLLDLGAAEKQPAGGTGAAPAVEATQPVATEPEPAVVEVDIAPEPEINIEPEPEPEPVVEETTVSDGDLSDDDLLGDMDFSIDDLDLEVDDIDLGIEESTDGGNGQDEGIDLNVQNEDLLDLDNMSVDEVVTEEEFQETKNDGGGEEEDIEFDFDLANEAFGGGIMGESSTSADATQELRDYDLALLELVDIININILEKKSKVLKEQDKIIEDDFFYAKLFIGLLVFVLTAFNMGQFFYFNRSVTQPIKRLRRYLISMGKGELPEFKMKVWKDDIGEMVRAVKNLLQGLKQTAFFANELGNGNLEAEYNVLSKGDILGNALMDMRDNLRRVADEDEKRNWANTGVADFSEILRRYNDNLDNLADQIIMYLVNYLKVNQGGIFLVNDLNRNDIFLELASVYAWDRKKFVEARVEKGQGLVGQCWYEQKTIFMTDVPEEFVKITSGLGEATPRCILIVPLISNEEIYGVLELASFKTLEEYEVEFVEKVAESIAAAVSNVKITEKTKILLEEAQQQGEELRANEEEMRQNMEEMNATQEEMDRILQEKDVVIDNLRKEIEELKK